jgi:hypothetical protein
MITSGRCPITAVIYAGDISIAMAFTFVLERLSFFKKGSNKKSLGTYLKEPQSIQKEKNHENF